jgi:hypothetical protein
MLLGQGHHATRTESPCYEGSVTMLLEWHNNAAIRAESYCYSRNRTEFHNKNQSRIILEQEQDTVILEF